MENLTREICVNCGIEFFVTKGFSDLCKKDCRSFYCPMGHCMSYSKTSMWVDKKDIEFKDVKIRFLEQELEKARKPKRKYNKK